MRLAWIELAMSLSAWVEMFSPQHISCCMTIIINTRTASSSSQICASKAAASERREEQPSNKLHSTRSKTAFIS
jgi:hypothetical protein